MFHLRILFVALVLASQLVEAGTKEAYCTWHKSVTEERINAADALLLSASRPSQREAIKESIDEHLPFGFPVHGAATNEHLLAQPDFLIWYDNDLRTPLWTAHHLTSSEAVIKRKREESFRSDPRLKHAWTRSECADYKEGIFDQGHMVPRADMNHSESAMDHSFLMTNMSPQHCAFNRGVWQVLESLGRRWASKANDTWIIAGAIYDRDGKPGRDPDQVAWRMQGERGVRVGIPSHFYKVFVRKTDSGWDTLSFILPNTDTFIENEKLKTYLEQHIFSLSEISKKSGFIFLDGQLIHESNALWNFSGSMPGQLTSRCKHDYPDY